MASASVVRELGDELVLAAPVGPVQRVFRSGMVRGWMGDARYVVRGQPDVVVSGLMPLMMNGSLRLAV